MLTQSDWFAAIPILGLAITASVFGFAGGVDELPWQQSNANIWQSLVWGVFVGVSSTAICYFIAKMLFSNRRTLYTTWAIAAPMLPGIFSWVLFSVLAAC